MMIVMMMMMMMMMRSSFTYVNGTGMKESMGGWLEVQRERSKVAS